MSLASQSIAQVDLQKATDVAKAGLIAFLNRIPRDTVEQYGFSKDDELSQCYLGKPYQLHTISPSSLSKYQKGDTLNSITSETKMWYFPVMLGDEAKTILVIDQVDNRWEAVSLGYAELARKLSRMRKQWPRSKGYNPQLIVVFQAREYLFTVPEKDSYNLTSFESTHLGRIPSKTVNDFNKLDKLPDAIERLRPLVHKNIQSR
jgi:hypothetical protein